LTTPKPKPLPVRLFRGLEDGLLIAALAAMIGVAVGQIVLRNFFHVGLDWADAFLRFLVLWAGLLGAMVATREDHHITVDIASHVFSKRGQAAVRIVTDLFTAVVCLILTYAAVRFLREEYAGGAMAFGPVPTWAAESILPIAFGVIGVRYVRYFVVHVYQAITGAAPADEHPEAAP
jgi:TRAP-type C4-dicarboxylate transport system permease small subunit